MKVRDANEVGTCSLTLGEALEGDGQVGGEPSRLVPGNLWSKRAPVLCNARLEGRGKA